MTWEIKEGKRESARFEQSPGFYYEARTFEDQPERDILAMSYIPSLTLPEAIFASKPVSILLPVSLGLTQGLLSQPGRSTPKTSDEPNPERRTFRRDVQERYMALRQPPLRPPPWIFAPVWTGLYCAMGYAAHLAWTRGMGSKNPRIVEYTRRGATLYTIQLCLNMLWMPLFFGLGRPVEALFDCIGLTGSVVYLTYIWDKVDKTAARLMVPYCAWLAFATYLNAATGALNGWSFKQTGRGEEKKRSDEAD